MKKSPVLLLMLGCWFVQANAQDLKKTFNDGWQFHSGEAAPDQISPQEWKAVQLPHDWAIESPFSEEWASATGYLPGGVGWYQKTFKTQPTWLGKKVFIYFDGVYKNSEVYLNGQLLGKRPNGFIAFKYDLTPYLKEKGDNLLQVKVDHRDFADSRWYTGSGIYRNVYVYEKDKTYIDPWDVAFTTPKVTSDLAEINTSVKITNSLGKKEKLNLQISILDSKGKLVATQLKKFSTAGKTQDLLFKMIMNQPRLWSPESPQLYNLQVSLKRNGKVIDLISQQVGIRSIRFDKDNGFFLNDKEMKIKGVCIHDDAGALGVAVPKEVWARRLDILKEGGVNSVRMGHNPHADYLYDLCDEKGFLVMDEAFDEWEIGKNKWVKGWNVGTPAKNGYHEYFKQWAEADLRNMVLRSRNHPSIFMWSIGNEIDYPNDPYTHEVLNSGNNPQIYGKGYLPDHPPASQMTPIARRLAKAVKQYDTTRPVTAALAGVVMSNEVGLPEELDIVGYNYQEYRYPEDHRKFPNRIIYGSENGMRKNLWDAVDTNRYISAQYLWTGIDYLGEAGKWPQRSNGAGLLDLAGFKKPEYYYRQSLWSATPMVYTVVAPPRTKEQTGNWSQRRGQPTWNWTGYDELTVQGYTNCEEAELFINGQSQGRKKCAEATLKIPAWNVKYAAGSLVIKGYNSGKLVAQSALKTYGEASRINASADKYKIKQGAKGIRHIEIEIADTDNNRVQIAENEILVEVTGNGKLLGLESGSNDSHESYQSNKRRAVRGRLLAFVQLSGNTGQTEVKISAPGLQSKTIILNNN
ncbi:sugar-binding domain-containing protein [Mucilaginibacter terrae]|uniref:Beta-galactosidase n=1 Tax=Mucilaginibacter terrae TaxID=1955052 RepID=A0ABU3H3I6_9SPHI|nr:sugar-binding domain-containing protein [Mucilaginibacter terrae]MDT3405470.1 beta-galactosidase [Mucilaginibacter terrae]